MHFQAQPPRLVPLRNAKLQPGQQHLRLAVVLSLVAQEIGDLEHHPSTVLRLVGAAILLFLNFL